MNSHDELSYSAYYRLLRQLEVDGRALLNRIINRLSRLASGKKGREAEALSDLSVRLHSALTFFIEECDAIGHEDSPDKSHDE